MQQLHSATRRSQRDPRSCRRIQKPFGAQPPPAPSAPPARAACRICVELHRPASARPPGEPPAGDLDRRSSRMSRSARHSADSHCQFSAFMAASATLLLQLRRRISRRARPASPSRPLATALGDGLRGRTIAAQMLAHPVLHAQRRSRLRRWCASSDRRPRRPRRCALRSSPI